METTKHRLRSRLDTANGTVHIALRQSKTCQHIFATSVRRCQTLSERCPFGHTQIYQRTAQTFRCQLCQSSYKGDGFNADREFPIPDDEWQRAVPGKDETLARLVEMTSGTKGTAQAKEIWKGHSGTQTGSTLIELRDDGLVEMLTRTTPHRWRPTEKGRRRVARGDAAIPNESRAALDVLSLVFVFYFLALALVALTLALTMLGVISL